MYDYYYFAFKKITSLGKIKVWILFIYFYFLLPESLFGYKYCWKSVDMFSNIKKQKWFLSLKDCFKNMLMFKTSVIKLDLPIYCEFDKIKFLNTLAAFEITFKKYMNT